MLQGLMQDQPLLISNLITFVQRHNGDGEIVSRRVEGGIHRTAWAGIARRSRQGYVLPTAATTKRSNA